MSYSRFLNDRAIPVNLSYSEVRPMLRWVYAWMALGLLVTTVVSLFTYNAIAAGLDMSTATSLQIATHMRPYTGIMFVAIIAELGVVIGLTWLMSKISPTVAAALFMIYAALNGFTLSIVLLNYQIGSVVGAFLTTTVLFAAMSVIGFTTEIDLTRFRGLFFMALIGLFIAMIVNVFLNSGPLSLIVNIVGVLLFIGLTAYDTQRIKRMAADPAIQADGSLAAKLSIFGALALYLDFINLFLFLLRLMGRRR